MTRFAGATLEPGSHWPKSLVSPPLLMLPFPTVGLLDRWQTLLWPMLWAFLELPPSRGPILRHRLSRRRCPQFVPPQAGREHLLQALIAGYGSSRVAHLTCPLDLLPVQSLAAAAQVLNLTDDPLRALLPAAMDGGWQAFEMHDDLSVDFARLAGLALSLKGAPVTFTPDPETIVVAPRTVFPDDTLAAWGPVLPNLPWSSQALYSLGYPIVHLPASAALDAVYEGLVLARRYPTPGFASNLPTTNPDELSSALKAGHPGRPYGGRAGRRLA